MQAYIGENGVLMKIKRENKTKINHCDYQTYEFSKKEWGWYIFSGLGIMLGISYLFYDKLYLNYLIYYF